MITTSTINIPMNPLCELANQTWKYLEDLLQHFDEPERDYERFVKDTRLFFEERLSIYEKQRKELENEVNILCEEMNHLSDQLEMPRVTFDHSQLTLKEKKKLISEKIDHLKYLIIQRNKELIQLRELIEIKMKILGNQQIDIDQILSTDQGKNLVSTLDNQLNQFKENIRSVLNRIHAINSDISSKYDNQVNSFLSLNNDNQLSWLTDHHPLTASSLHSQLTNEYENLQKLLLEEVLRLRAELHQPIPPPPSDLLEELTNLRLRKRYLTLLSAYSHKLTSRSTLDEIRQTYEKLTASLHAQAREKLRRLWDQLDVPSDQRIFPKTKENEDDYLAMNDEIHRLEIYVESIRPLLIKIQKREWYKKEMIEFEKRAANPARLRGSSTQLLREERFRKDLSREFPKLTDDLRQMVAEWEIQTGKKLIYGGESYLDTMNKEKFSVDFELLHLRLLTKCQILVQTTPPETPPVRPTSRSTSTPPLSRSRIPTMNFVNSNRKIKK